jgi:hypothetical protein
MNRADALAEAKEWAVRYPQWIVGLVSCDLIWFGNGAFEAVSDRPLNGIGCHPAAHQKIEGARVSITSHVRIGEGAGSVNFVSSLVQANNQKISGSHSNAGTSSTPTMVVRSTAANHHNRFRLRCVKSSNGDNKCARQTATRKLTTLHNSRVHLYVHHAAKAPGGTVNQGLVPRIIRKVVTPVIAAQRASRDHLIVICYSRSTIGKAEPLHFELLF